MGPSLPKFSLVLSGIFLFSLAVLSLVFASPTYAQTATCGEYSFNDPRCGEAGIPINVTIPGTTCGAKQVTFDCPMNPNDPAAGDIRCIYLGNNTCSSTQGVCSYQGDGYSCNNWCNDLAARWDWSQQTLSLCLDPSSGMCQTQTCTNNSLCNIDHICVTQLSQPACSVSWAFSNSNPLTNSTVNVTVNGLSSNVGWSNVAYSLDGPPWNYAVTVLSSSIPRWQFSVPSGSAFTHALQFSARDSGGNTIPCTPTSSFVTQAPPQNNNASCGLYTVKNGSQVFVGETIPLSINMTNSGDTTWTSSSLYKLGAQQPQDNSHWGTTSGTDSGLGVRPTRKDLSATVGPSGSAPFNFEVSAPTTAGTYRLSFQMVKEGIEWFGGMCQKDVPVATPPPGVTPPPVFLPSCSGTVTNAATKTVRWDATVNPATPSTGSYTYSWSGDASGTTQSVTQTYATAGTKNATVKVTSGTTINPASCSVTIPTPSPAVDIKANNSNGPISLANNSSATLSWTTTQSPTSCTASATPSSSSWFGAKSVNGSSQSTGTLTGPQNYIYTLTCANAGGSGSDSVTVSVLGPSGAPPPTVPGAFSQTSSSLTAGCSNTSPYVDLSWTASTNAQTYSVFRNSSSIITGLTTLFFRDLNVGSTTTYSYLIRAVNTAGSTDSDTKSITTLNCSSQTPPPSSGCAWIQTTGGDVHSNTGINTPCGP